MVQGYLNRSWVFHHEVHLQISPMIPMVKVFQDLRRESDLFLQSLLEESVSQSCKARCWRLKFHRWWTFLSHEVTVTPFETCACFFSFRMNMFHHGWPLMTTTFGKVWAAQTTILGNLKLIHQMTANCRPKLIISDILSGVDIPNILKTGRIHPIQLGNEQ